MATPTFSIGAGTYTTEKTVTVTVLTSGVTIHYTLTGTDPTESDPVVASGGSADIEHAAGQVRLTAKIT